MKFEELVVGEKVYINSIGSNVVIRGLERTFLDQGFILVDKGLIGNHPNESRVQIQVGGETMEFDRLWFERAEPPIPDDITPLDMLFREVDLIAGRESRCSEGEAYKRLIHRIEAVRAVHGDDK